MLFFTSSGNAMEDVFGYCSANEDSDDHANSVVTYLATYYSIVDVSL